MRDEQPAADGTPPAREAAAPAFATRDSSRDTFWDERFAAGFTPWDQAGVPRAFAEFAQRLAPCPVLIPGCGRAYEARWLGEAGWPVRAIDFSAQAVEAARVQLGAHAGLVEQADFFAYQPPVAPGWIYERTFLCALPPAYRAAYARRMAELLPAGGVLAGFFLLGETQGGPPFAIERAELDALLTPDFVCVEDAGVDDSLALFAGRERWQVWRRR